MPTQPNGGSRVVIDQAILDRIDEIRPHYMDRTTFINFQLDNVITLGARPAGAGSLYKDLNKEEDRAREELINVPPTPAPKKPKDPWSLKKVNPALVPEDIDGNHAELFVEWWSVRSKGAVRSEKVAWRLSRVRQAEGLVFQGPHQCPSEGHLRRLEAALHARRGAQAQCAYGAGNETPRLPRCARDHR